MKEEEVRKRVGIGRDGGGGREPSDFSPATSRLNTRALFGTGARCPVTTDKTSFKTGPATCSVIQHKLLTFPTI